PVWQAIHYCFPPNISSTHSTFSGTIFAKNFKYHFRKASHHAFRKAFHPPFRQAFQARIPPFLARFLRRISNTIFVKHPISLFATHSIPRSAKHFLLAFHLYCHDFCELLLL